MKVEDVLKKKKNKDLVAINLMDEMKDKVRRSHEGGAAEKEDEGTVIINKTPRK